LYDSSGGDPASCEDTAKLPAHLSEHYRDPMTFNPEVSRLIN